jgi:phosphatidate cytidylyltransferase
LWIAAVFASAYFAPQACVWVGIAVVSMVGQLEFYAMMDKAGIPVYRVVGVICGTALITATYFTAGPEPGQMAAGYRWENIVLLASMLAVFIRQFPQKLNIKPMETIGGTLMGILYVPFLMNYITRLAFAWTGTDSSMRMGQTGAALFIFLILVVKVTDIGAFTAGSLFGRHKLFPRISPGKTWEGLLGGVLFAIATSWAIHHFNSGKLGTISFHLNDAIILGVLLAVAGTVGDLFESLIKRTAGVKDSGALFPGMGGLLDVIDSLLFGAPVLYGYVSLVLR